MLVATDVILRALYRAQLDARALSEAAYVVLAATCENAELPGGHPGPEKEIIDSAEGLGAEICHPDSLSRVAA